MIDFCSWCGVIGIIECISGGHRFCSKAHEDEFSAFLGLLDVAVLP